MNDKEKLYMTKIIELDKKQQQQKYSITAYRATRFLSINNINIDTMSVHITSR